MSKILAAAGLAAAMLAGTSVASYATPTKGIIQSPTNTDLSFTGVLPTGTLGKGTPASGILGSGQNAVAVFGKFDLFEFSVPILGSYTVKSVVNTAVPPSGSKSLNFTAFDYFTLGASGFQQYGAPGVVGVDPFNGDSAGLLSTRTLAAGTYYVGVEATGTKGSSYSGTLTVSSVPLPTSVALFGTALAGLGVAGAVRRKKSISAAV